MKKTIQVIFLTLAALLLVGLGILTLCFPQTAPSQYDPWENRNLADTPDWSFTGVFDGSLSSEIESYLSDHLYGRTSLLRTNVRLQQLLGYPCTNGVLESDTVLVPDNGVFDESAAATEEDAGQIAAGLAAARNAAEVYGGTLLYVSVPTQRTVFSDAYPSYLNSDAARINGQLSKLRTALEEAGIASLFWKPEADGSMTEVYSPVDHHFTLNGACQCCEAVIAALNESGQEIPTLPEDLTFEALPNPMLGTYNRKLYGFSRVSGSLLIYHTDAAVSYTRWDNGVQTDAPLIVLPENDTDYVQYTAYMGGDKAETVIQTNRSELKKLLIVGDSFTNAMETMLYLSFDEMRSLDFRYYTEKTLSEYIADYQPDVVLVVRDYSVCLTTEGNGNLK